MYRHAGIDIYLGTRFQDRGAGTEAVGLLARFCSSGAVTTGSRSARTLVRAGPCGPAPAVMHSQTGGKRGD
jgi:hypothetical protein